MADIALRLKVFVASPGDLTPERELVERLVGAAADDCKRHRLLLQCFRWENGATPGYERPQARINRQLRTAELTVVMFWTRLGSSASLDGEETGSLEELRIAGEQVMAGASDDVFVYFKTAPPPGQANAIGLDDVGKLRQRLDQSKSVFIGEFATLIEFESLFRRHLSIWIERWVGLPEICEFALDHAAGSAAPDALLADARMNAILYRLDLQHARDTVEMMGRAAVDAYQREGPVGWLRPLTPEMVARLKAAPSGSYSALIDAASSGIGSDSGGSISAVPLAVANGQVHFSDQEWFYFCCAAGLIEAVGTRHVDAVARHPYVNPVHQYLKGLALEWRVNGMLVPVLRDWLLNVGGTTANRPIARNFAAYVLGMLGAYEAHEDLARAIQTDSGQDVRRYCVTSLGKLRARPQLPVLRELYAREPSADFRLTIAQAICRMTGVADYEM